MNRKTAILCVFLAVLCSPACLQQHSAHTLYLSPDGAVTWTTTERDVRSDARDPAEQAREEGEFLNRLSAGEHPMLTALRSLDPSSSRVRFLRRERPYLVLTEARFDRADRLMQTLIDELRIRGSASLTRTADQTTLSVVFEVPEGEPESSDESPITPLTDFDEPYRFVLTAGRFVSATGLTLESDETVAALDEAWMTERCKPGATIALTLTWVTTTPNSQLHNSQTHFQLPNSHPQVGNWKLGLGSTFGSWALGVGVTEARAASLRFRTQADRSPAPAAGDRSALSGRRMTP